MTDTLTVTVRVGDHEIERKYGIDDGQAPEDMQERIQNMVDTVLEVEHEH